MTRSNEVTKRYCDYFKKNKDYTDFSYHGKKKKYVKHMPIIATENVYDKNVFKSMEFETTCYEERTEYHKENISTGLHFLINGHCFHINELANSFLPSSCSTIYRYQ